MTQSGSRDQGLCDAHSSVLARSIPALVHRANNCLAVIDGTLDMAERLDPEQRTSAQAESGVLRDLLRHLALQSRVELEEVGAIEVTHLLQELEFVLGIIGRFRRCDVEFRRSAFAATIQGDRARLYRLLVSLCTERLLALFASGAIGSLMRVGFGVRRGMARFTITDTGAGVASDPDLQAAFAGEVQALGRIWDFELRSRVLGRAHAYVLRVPVLTATALGDGDRGVSKGRHILLLQPDGVDAELHRTLLAEKGYRVEHRATARDLPELAGFDLVLCDEELLSELPPSAPPLVVLGERGPGDAAFDAVPKPIKPRDLLECVGGALETA